MTLTLYALVDERPAGPLGRGAGETPLAVIRAGKAWLVVEPAPPRAVSPAAVVAHDRVIRRVARAIDGAILPLRFASAADDAPAARALVAPFASVLVGAFDRVRAAVQFTIRVVLPPAGSRAKRPTRPGAAKLGPGARWLERRIAAHRVPEIALLSEAAAPFVREVRIERRDASATVYHLVPRSEVRAWRRAVNAARPRLARGIEVSVTGPWPPYAFAELG